MARSPKRLIVPVILIVVLAVLVQFQVLTIAFGKLGLSAQSAYLLLMVTLILGCAGLPNWRAVGLSSNVLTIASAVCLWSARLS